MATNTELEVLRLLKHKMYSCTSKKRGNWVSGKWETKEMTGSSYKVIEAIVL